MQEYLKMKWSFKIWHSYCHREPENFFLRSDLVLYALLYHIHVLDSLSYGYFKVEIDPRAKCEMQIKINNHKNSLFNLA